MSMLEFRQKLPVITELGEGWAIYVQSSGIFANDIWCVALDDGRILHFLTSQLTVVPNGTLGVHK